MQFKETKLKGNFIIDLNTITDERGFFSRFFCENEFNANGLNTHWVQINNSMNKEVGTLRGLHFQRPPHSEVKLIRCIKGAIWDVVVDLRMGSKTYGEWFGATLSEKNRTMMYVPQGLAHGFISLESNAEIIYLVSNKYEPNAEGTLIWNDSDIKIEWPMQPVMISQKDLIGDPLEKIKPINI